MNKNYIRVGNDIIVLGSLKSSVNKRVRLFEPNLLLMVCVAVAVCKQSAKESVDLERGGETTLAGRG